MTVHYLPDPGVAGGVFHTIPAQIIIGEVDKLWGVVTESGAMQ